MYRLELSRSQILGFRQRVGALDERLPAGTESLRQAAWAGLQDSMPRAALLSVDPRHALLELVRRYLHVFGPATEQSFARWAGVRPRDARLAWEALDGALTPVRTLLDDAWILAEDETAFRTQSGPAAPARLLPSGDAYYLLSGADRQLLVPDAKRRAAQWTTRVWPGALLVNGEIAGVWRRSAGEVSIEAWRRLSSVERHAVEAEAVSLPLPALSGPINVDWS